MATVGVTSARVELGRALLKSGEPEKAEVAFRQALATDGRDEGARLGLAAALTAQGKKAEAIGQCEVIADLYMANGREVKAVEVYARVLRLDPGRPETHAKLGELLMKLGRPKEAIREMKAAAAAHRARTMGEDHIPTLKRIVDMTPDADRAPLRLELAAALSKAGRNAEALAIYREEVKLLDAVAELEVLGNRGSQRGGGNAAKLLVQGLEAIAGLEPNDVEARVKLARYQLYGKPAKALSALQAALKLDRNNLSAIKLLDHAFLALGQTDKAALSFDSIKKLEPRYGLPAKRPDDSPLGGALKLIDDYLAKDLPHKAMETARDLVSTHPDSITARNRLKALFLQVGDPEPAVVEISVCVGLALKLGEIPWARSLLQEGLKLAPGHPRVRECCVQVAERL